MRSSHVAAMNAASASRSDGGMVRPSLVRRHKMSSGKRAHSFCHEIAHFRAVNSGPKAGPRSPRTLASPRIALTFDP